MADLLIELFSEEIPALMQKPAAAALAKAMRDGLAERRMPLADDALRTCSSPRRLALVASGVAEAEPRRTVRRRGPRVDAPEQAQTGFRRSLQGTTFTLEQVEEKKGTFWVAVVEEGGAPAAGVLKELLEAFLPRFPWPKSMRWGDGDARWVRPLHHIVCLLDGTVVPVRFAGIEASDTTRGHRFMAPAPIRLDGARDYAEVLRGAKVLVDPAERRVLIEAEARRLATDAGLVLRDDPGLLEEVAGLAEWPVPLLGRIDEPFMALPPEVLETTMRSHQRYLALSDEHGNLAPRFVLVANLEAVDGGAAIVEGNERVLRARLWDARFFWDNDRKAPLTSRMEALERMVFHARLGSMAAKARRLERLAGRLARRFDTVPADEAARAGLLAKADLVTGMVGEFPELQGVMGAYYARAQGESDPVVDAIRRHYAPQGPSEACPKEPLAVVLALTDKLDSLVGLHAAGERATGSSDALGLRRLALGIIRIVLENGLRTPLRALFVEAIEGYDEALDLPPATAVADELMGFTVDRLKVHLRGEGLAPDLITAVLDAGREDDLVRVRAKVRALAAFLATTDGADLLALYKRARNIVRIETKRDGVTVDGPVAETLLEAATERDLNAHLDAITPRIAQALETERYTDAMGDLATLRAPLDQFFEEVLVNADVPELRSNRLRLLARLSGLLDGIAVFDVIEEPHRAA